MPELMLKRAIPAEISSLLTFLLTLVLYPKFKLVRFFRAIPSYKKLTLRGLLYRRGQLGKSFVNLGIAGLAACAVIGGTVLGPLPSLAFQSQPKVVAVVETPNNPQTTIPEGRPRATTIQYQVKDGDSLQSVADKFKVSADTVSWANSLGGNNLTPGQTILVPPVTGIVHIVTTGESLAKVASDAGVSVADIKSYPFNDIPDNGGLEQGQIVIVPNGRPVEIVHPAPPSLSAPAPAASPAVHSTPTRYVAPAPVPVIHYSTYNSYPFGQCTYYVASRRNIPWLDNAGGWYADARAAGFAVGRTPRAGAIMVSYEGSPYGHVSYVERVNRDGSWVVSEMNYAGVAGGGWGRVDTRTVYPGTIFIVGFIY